MYTYIYIYKYIYIYNKFDHCLTLQRLTKQTFADSAAQNGELFEHISTSGTHRYPPMLHSHLMLFWVKCPILRYTDIPISSWFIP